MNVRNMRAVRRIARLVLQSDRLSGCDLCLAISPGGCSGLACGVSLIEGPWDLDAKVENDRVEPLRESPQLCDSATIDLPNGPKRIGFVLPDHKQVSNAHY
ncbi:hypothetical protein GCM10007857_67550 [Bradyrhizobium iriomotense]|uniref:Uncharacterized protein n=1 Tax=Bradyrhizobium iriomotense TaxID=441950 RepID=A0ABQ6B843_9BRAD|nr:hypothetical protein GCM10007857_67550 [Bradyrhizobium iriomotense]